MYDAIVVGARCGGSPTAMLLARMGYRVLVVDKATFPKDTISTHWIWPAGVAFLKRWDLLDRVHASNCPPISNISWDFGPFPLVGSPPPADGGIRTGYGPRRTVLDQILIDAAVEAGAELRQGFSVKELVMDDDRVVGIRGHAQGGSLVAEKAPIVIGADGMNSFVARVVNAPKYHETPPLAVSFYTFWSGVPWDKFEVYLRGEQRRWIGMVPTNDGLINLFVSWPVEEYRAFRNDIEGNYLKTLELVPQLAERVRGGKREERFFGKIVPNFFHKPYGPGWALVGDAGCDKDPTTGQGITDAFRDAALLAEAIDAGLAGTQPMQAALAEYEQRRNAVSMPTYQFTCEACLYMPPPPERVEFLHALRGNQPEIDRFHGCLAGTVPFAEFWAPENLERIMHAA